MSDVSGAPKRWLPLAGRIALVSGCSLVSALVIGLSDSELWLAGSTMPTIWAPALDRRVTLTLIALSIALVAASGVRLRLPALALWLVLLAILTHRVVDRRDDGIRNTWLAIEVGRSAGLLETDVQPHPCGSLVAAICFSAGGERHLIPTLIPFVPRTALR